MSSTSFLGLAIVSPKNAFVLGRAAARQSPGSSGFSTKRDLDAELGQRVVEQVVGAAVQAGAGHDVIAASATLRIAMVRGLPAGDQQCTDAAFQRRDPIFDGRLGRVHDPRVDVAQFLQGKRFAACVVVERVRRRLIDRQRRAWFASSGVWPAWICLVSKDQASLMMCFSSGWLRAVVVVRDVGHRARTVVGNARKRQFKPRRRRTFRQHDIHLYLWALCIKAALVFRRSSPGAPHRGRRVAAQLGPGLTLRLMTWR